MKRTGIIGLLCLALLMTVAGPASAHSKKGRMKIDLTLEHPTVNDFAFFMDSYVNNEFYRDRFGDTGNRFYVKDFKSVEQKGNRATVTFIALDVKENRDFEDTMTFEREDGVWYYHTPKGEHITVYTFVMKGAYYYQHYILPFSIPGLIVSACLLGGIMFVRKRRARLPLPQ